MRDVAEIEISRAVNDLGYEVTGVIGIDPDADEAVITVVLKRVKTCLTEAEIIELTKAYSAHSGPVVIDSVTPDPHPYRTVWNDIKNFFGGAK